MGYSITAEQGAKLDKLRRENRLCGGATRTRVGCLTRATTEVTSEVWTHRIGEGKAHVSPLRMCTRHARQQPVGFEGVNFRVLSKARLP